MVQWLTDFYPQGKTSIASRFNIPGKIGWATMEAPGFVTLLYIMTTLPTQNGLKDLPAANWLMAGLFVSPRTAFLQIIQLTSLQTMHYIYRALLSPLVLNPSMAPIHILVWLAALCFQLVNASCIGGWLAGYGPTTAADWQGRMLTVQVGVVIFVAGFVGNIVHDDELRAIRRNASRDKGSQSASEDGSKVVKDGKVYQIPTNGLFAYVLYPHFLCEWIEWLGFWIIGGWNCVPARNFVLNEISTMTPRALAGQRWYIRTFGKEKIGSRKAVVPGLV